MTWRHEMPIFLCICMPIYNKHQNRLRDRNFLIISADEKEKRTSNALKLQIAIKS